MPGCLYAELLGEDRDLARGAEAAGLRDVDADGLRMTTNKSMYYGAAVPSAGIDSFTRTF
jgi:hypothetical protein